jgi:hypothetical protein
MFPHTGGRCWIAVGVLECGVPMAKEYALGIAKGTALELRGVAWPFSGGRRTRRDRGQP